MTHVEVGSILAGHRLDSVAGQGGMGIVYRATHLELEREVALKVISPVLASDGGFRERFKRESRTAASLRHPHIVTIYDAGEDQDLLYITMEYVEGTDLRRLIRERDPIGPELAADLVGQVAAALDAAHQRGLVHRDVKPANVLIRHEHVGPVAYLTDFGLTRHATSVGGPTGTGQWVGTLDYVAPEQVQGEPVDGRADVYSLACVLFEALAGQVPYPRDNDMAKMWAQVNEPPPSLLERRPGSDPSLDHVIAKGMAKDRDERYASAIDLANGALAAVGGTPLAPAPGPSAAQATSARTITGPSTPATPATGDPARAGRRRLALLGAAALVAIGGGYAVASATSGEDSSGTEVEAGNVRLSHGPDWEEDVSGGRAIESLALQDPIALDYSPLSGAGILRAGTVTGAAGDPGDPLPPSLVRRYSKAPKPQAVDVNGAGALLYGGVTKGKDPQRLSLLMVPTDSGYVGVACEAPRAGAQSFPDECERVAASLELVDAAASGLDADPRLAKAVQGALSDLQEAQTDAQDGLAADRSQDQAAAAASLSDAYRAAADAMIEFDARPQEEDAVAALQAALERLSEAFDALGQAAEDESRKAYAAAQQQSAQASAELADALDELRRLGYKVG